MSAPIDNEKVHRVSLSLLASLVAVLALAGTAAAGGGNYVFDGGTPVQRAQVRAALEASAFDWGLVPARVTIHLAPGTDSDATRGEIWIDANLLTAGRYAWGTIQHEYAHQVDFFLLSDEQRASSAPKLGGSSWYPTPGTRAGHDQLTAERFASTLAWAYWPSADNSLHPTSARDEAAALPAAQFRGLLVSILGPGAAPVSVRSLLSVKRR